MSALAAGLVKAQIDQVAQEVHVLWVQPRVLSLEQVSYHCFSLLLLSIIKFESTPSSVFNLRMARDWQFGLLLELAFTGWHSGVAIRSLGCQRQANGVCPSAEGRTAFCLRSRLEHSSTYFQYSFFNVCFVRQYSFT